MRRVKGLSPACDREKAPVVRTARLLGQFLQPVAHPYSNSIFPYRIRPRCAAHGVLGHGGKGAFLSSRGLASCIAPGGKGLAMLLAQARLGSALRHPSPVLVLQGRVVARTRFYCFHRPVEVRAAR